MARKRKLSELISEETQQTTAPESEPIDSVTTEVTNSGGLEVTELQTNKVSDIQSNKVTNPVSSKVTEIQNNKVTDSKSTEVSKLPTQKVADSQSSEVPKYLTLVRKEARLREEQLDKLTSLTRSLNRKRRGTGERITENTLIRVAVDLLLNKSDELKGSTEQELKESVSLKVTD